MPKTRLLLIEDDYDIAELLTTFFDGMDYEFFHAADGPDGLAVARARFPNVILLDVMLPGMNGWEIANALRAVALTRYIPIMFLTQRDARSDKLKGLTLGADDYITKPFDIEELGLRVQGMVRRATQSHIFDPRTGLPGAPMIETELENRKGQRGWSHYTVNIEGFEAFREAYGFMAGDEALAYTANALQETLRVHGTENDFVGINDADQFVILTHSRKFKKFKTALQESFANKIHTLYNFADFERGYLVLNPDTDQEKHAPLMKLDIQDVS